MTFRPRRRAAVRAGAVAAGAMLVLSGQTAAASAAVMGSGDPPATWGPYQYVNRSSGKCLEVADWRLDEWAPVRQWDCTGGNNQKWKLVGRNDVERSFWKMVNVHSGKCLHWPPVGGRSPWGGTELIQLSCAQDTLWSIPEPYGPEAENTVIGAGYDGLVLEIGGFSGAQGAPAQLWWSNGGANQLWERRR
ncbi:RICIN domain-containing protein [Kitasatospora sp. NPDC056327]|uniref:RICIN domain-containing protein n=1 Tax=Kitasatospora sp. NPDC056327 TaxID=3345785 RepID=UPI0035E32796